MRKLEVLCRFDCLALVLLMLVGLAACGSDVEPDDRIAVELGGRRADRLAAFYFGSFLSPALVDSVLTMEGGRALVDTVRLKLHAPAFANALLVRSLNGRVSREGLREAVQEIYRSARSLPDDLSELNRAIGLDRADSASFSVTLDGSMTRHRREIHLPLSALRAGLEQFAERGEILYPQGTAIVGKHVENGEIVETTVMLKRGDGFWDYAAYDASGSAVDWIEGEPDPLAVPTQCFGCHYGNRLFEPEKSFPGEAPDGLHGRRGLWVDETLRDPEVVTIFDEHRRRADGVLGIYGTLYVSALRGKQVRNAAEDQILEALGL